MKIPIFTDDPGWHGEQLKKAFYLRGVEAVFVSLRQCVIELSGQQPTIVIPGFDELPKAAFVRGVSGGTLQQVITRLNILHILSMLGVKVYNDAKAIERTVDKGLTSFLLQKNGVTTPNAWVCESKAAAQSIRVHAEQTGQQLVIKPLFGSQGTGVRKLAAEDCLPVPMQQFVDGVYYFQTLVETQSAPHDYRLFVIGDTLVASMRRTGAQWLNNVAAGGRCEAHTPSDALVELALKAKAALDIDYAGVDIIQKKSGEYTVLEVNSIPAWRGLQGATQCNVAQNLVNHFLSSL